MRASLRDGCLLRLTMPTFRISRFRAESAFELPVEAAAATGSKRQDDDSLVRSGRGRTRLPADALTIILWASGPLAVRMGRSPGGEPLGSQTMAARPCARRFSSQTGGYSGIGQVGVIHSGMVPKSTSLVWGCVALWNGTWRGRAEVVVSYDGVTKTAPTRLDRTTADRVLLGERIQLRTKVVVARVVVPFGLESCVHPMHQHAFGSGWLRCIRTYPGRTRSLCTAGPISTHSDT